VLQVIKGECSASRRYLKKVRAVPIPFIFPIAGFLLAGGGAGMRAHYFREDQVERTRLDAWLTDVLKAAVKGYLKFRHGIDIAAGWSADEQEAYWRGFGLHLDAFLEAAQPIARKMYCKPFEKLTRSEQAEVIRHIARDRNEGPE
jgi:hypothetical protein